MQNRGDTGASRYEALNMSFVREISDKLGLSFVGTVEGAKKVFAAARGTEVEKDVKQVVKAFYTMSAALSLTSDEINSVFLAISQMLSKGKISVEELRQLANYMRGVETLFAKALCVSTEDFDTWHRKGHLTACALRAFAVEVEETYAADAECASRGLQAQLNRLENARFDLKRALANLRKSRYSD